MKLSELQTGDKGVIVKVSGHGGFRKRVIEMGFIKGKKVEVLLNAPLRDPVKYRIMGYEVSLRHSEADQIEVVSLAEARKRKQEETTGEKEPLMEFAESNDSDDKMLQAEAEHRRRTINVALVGNPNCGKTSLFNFASGAHERVGNYSGVTVDAKVGHAEYEGYEFNLVDLPGTYSLSAYSPEELYVRKQLIEHTPDIVINVIDSSNLERNLYLTTQLIDMHIKMVVALNMFDETEKRGDNVDYDKLGSLFGIPMIPTVFTNGRGVENLFHEIIKIYEMQEDEDPHYRHIHINHGHEIENGIAEIQDHLKKENDVRQRYSTRYLAIKLLERDKDVERYIQTMPDAKEIFEHRDQAALRVKEETLQDSETAIMDAKYGFIHGALKEAEYTPGHEKDTYQITHVLDSIMTNKYVGFPIFLIMLCIMFTATFVLGAYPMEWIEDGIALLGDFIGKNLPAGPVKDMLIDGVIGRRRRTGLHSIKIGRRTIKDGAVRLELSTQQCSGSNTLDVTEIVFIVHLDVSTIILGRSIVAINDGETAFTAVIYVAGRNNISSCRCISINLLDGADDEAVGHSRHSTPAGGCAIKGCYVITNGPLTAVGQYTGYHSGSNGVKIIFVNDRTHSVAIIAIVLPYPTTIITVYNPIIAIIFIVSRRRCIDCTTRLRCPTTSATTTSTTRYENVFSFISWHLAGHLTTIIAIDSDKFPTNIVCVK